MSDGEEQTSEPSYAYVVSERDFVTILIDLYRARPELWMVKHEKYQDRVRRKQLYEEIVNELQQYKPGFTEDALRKKINVLRTNFKKETHRIRAKGGSETGDNVKTTLWYYKNLSFLIDMERDESMTAYQGEVLDPDCVVTIQKQDSDGEDDEHRVKREFRKRPMISSYTRNHAPQLLKSPAPVTIQHSSAHQSTPLVRKKIRIKKKHVEVGSGDSDSEVEQYMTVTTSYFRRKKTREDLLAETWAMKLKALAQDQRIYAEKIINDVFVEAELGNLTREGVSFCPNFP